MKYIIIFAVIVSVILYYGMSALFWRLKERSVRQRVKRLTVCVLIVALLAGQTDFVNFLAKTGAETAAAEEPDVETEEDGSRMITAFTELPDEVREQIVPVGTTLEELELPDTLEAVCGTAYADPDELGGVTLRMKK